MKKFLDENFLLQSKTAEMLYHDFAKEMPIIDYHNHLPPKDILENGNFENLTQAWLYGDHYKWRGMRANGINERFCTGNATDYEKFEKWAETVPYTMRNPLYHWSHLELQRYFGINEILNPASAKGIYENASEQLRQPSHSIQGLLKMMNAKVVCTTDDPLDSLEHHTAFAKKGNKDLKMLPAFRPDRFLMPEKPNFLELLTALENLTGKPINDLQDLKNALSQRADYFHEAGCRVSDHGLERINFIAASEEDVNSIFAKILNGEAFTQDEHGKLQTNLLVFLGQIYAKKGWVQQFHLGALRNNNLWALKELGPDTGWDSIGDWSQAAGISKLLGTIGESGELAKTIIYNLNPADNEVMATMIGNFNDGSVAGKIQWGSGWWFLDQKDGMEKQLNTLSQMGLLSRFVGMLTDSRSFLSFPRHEYFRRILCNLLGNDIENGELPNDIPWIGQMVQDICYNNAKNYFNFE
ncbi:D-glucuronate isomerase [Spirosomataceae bacterium TFI 002]|nr:D-glucuronate isomerase [Spirosomataceae bacterium TFI 002]